ncbi:MAG: hypothetical protein K6G31_06455 [Paludibacteraceae bacterium]|nr:hypothetical protein [Paludibacteraceae bacterium]
MRNSQPAIATATEVAMMATATGVQTITEKMSATATAMTEVLTTAQTAGSGMSLWSVLGKKKPIKTLNARADSNGPYAPSRRKRHLNRHDKITVAPQFISRIGEHRHIACIAERHQPTIERALITRVYLAFVQVVRNGLKDSYFYFKDNEILKQIVKK